MVMPIEFRSRKNGASNAMDVYANLPLSDSLSSESQEGLPSCLNMKMHFEIMMRFPEFLDTHT